VGRDGPDGKHAPGLAGMQHAWNGGIAGRASGGGLARRAGNGAWPWRRGCEPAAHPASAAGADMTLTQPNFRTSTSGRRKGAWAPRSAAVTCGILITFGGEGEYSAL